MYSNVTWLIRHPDGHLSTLTTGAPCGPSHHAVPDLTDYPCSQFPDGAQIVGSFAHLVGGFHVAKLEKDWDERFPVFHIIPFPDGTAQCWKNWDVVEIRSAKSATTWLKRMKKQHDHAHHPRRGIRLSKDSGASGLFDLYSHGHWVKATRNRSEAQAWLRDGKP